MFDGNHNSKRPIHVLQIIALFFFDKLKVDSIHTLNEIYDNNLISDDDDVVNEEDNKYSSVNSIKVKNDINHYFDNL